MKLKKNKEEDMKVRKRIEAKNELEAYAFQLQGTIQDMKNLGVTEKGIMEGAIKHTVEWMDENDAADIIQIQNKKKRFRRTLESNYFRIL